jgi:hypothetical protein
LASIRFTDTIGTATVTNGLDQIARGVGSRFAGWVPFQRAVGATATALGTGARTMYRFRTDYGASFQLRDIETTHLPEVLRLMEHLEAGGTVTVFTDDVYGRSYASCCLAPDGTVGLEMANNTDLTYTLSLALLNLGAVPMLCDYSPSIGPASILFDWDVSRGITTGTYSRGSDASFVTRNA